MYRSSSLLFLLVFLAIELTGQGLPRHLTPDEEAEMPDYIREVKNRSQFTEPPQGSHIRSIAEWEELKGIAISWVSYYENILTEIVRHASKEGIVYIHCEDESTLKNYLIGEGIDISENVEFIETDLNSVWIRDYGPNSVYLNGTDSLVFIDWIYNRPRPDDDVIPSVLGDRLNVPVIATDQAPNDLVHTGGNYFTDGMGMAFSSELVLEENGPDNEWGMSNHEEEDIDRILRDYMGIDEYVKFESLPYDIIHHIDMHMKLVGEETLLVGEYPPGVADGPQIEANLQYLISNFKTGYDRSFDIVRIPMPPDRYDRYPDNFGNYRTYTNAVFVNKSVLVPTYEEKYDTTALKIWRRMLPGYKIVGINSNKIIPQAGAIHCITKEIGVEDPIWITHKKLRKQDLIDETSVEIRSNVRSSLGIDSVFLYHSSEGDHFDTRPMQLFSGDSIWTADLTIPANGDSLFYYFTAFASNGKTVHYPLPGKEAAIRLELPDQTTAGQPINASPQSFAVYPNPASAITCIEIEASKAQLSLYNSMGIQVASWKTSDMRGTERFFFDARSFAPGIYVISVRTDKQIFSRKIVITR